MARNKAPVGAVVAEVNELDSVNVDVTEGPGAGVEAGARPARVDAENAMQHHIANGSDPLDTVQVMDDNGDFLSIEEVCKQYDTTKKKPGRPGVYDNEFHPRAAFLLCADLGAEYTQIARNFGVSYNTVIAWVWRYPLFADAVRKGWSIHMVRTAEKALLQRAVGFEYEETKRQRVPVYDTIFDDRGKPHKVIRGYEEVVVERTTKQVAPDTTALMFLLQNRDGHRWKNVRKVEHTTRNENTIPGIDDARTPERAVLDLDTVTLENIVRAARSTNTPKEETPDDC